MIARARAVVIGGGITGCSVAYHLARAGFGEVALLDKGQLTSGSTCHAAGLVTQFNPSPTMMRFRRYSIELYRELGVFETVGSVRIASTPESLAELQRGASRARAIGLDVELSSPEETLELLPAISPAALFGSVYLAGDGFLDPHTATWALATAARELGVTILTDTRVTGIELGSSREVCAVITEHGRIECEVVVNAAGMWAPQVSAMVGAFTPSAPIDHQHIALAPVTGHELPREMPCFRDPDNLVYGKSETGGILFGGYEHDAPPRWIDGVPWEHSGQTVPADEERFAPLMEGAIRRFPFLEDAGVVKLVAHPDAMTPDGNPLLGPMPGLRGFYLAAGLSLNGFGGAGGIGKAIAEWITTGETELDVQAYRAWRFGEIYREAGYTAATAQEAYRYYYRLRYPLDSDQAGRPRRVSALYSRLQEAGAVFGCKNGWERADYFQPGSAWRRAGEDQRAFGWSKPPYFERLAAECAAIRERVGIVDMSSFGKIEVTGPDAAVLLERACANRVDRPVGSVVYGQLLDDRAGIVADVTITRLAEERFRVVTGAGTVASDLGWLRQCLHDGERVALRDASDESCVIGFWGPHARAVLQAVTRDDVGNEALPFYQARELEIAGARVLAQRLTYVGELGYELYVAPEDAVQVWDRLLAAGAAFGIAHVGYRAIDSLRMEKGYRYMGADIGAGDRPDEAGLAFCVPLARKGAFRGRAAVERARASDLTRRIRTLAVGVDAGYLPLYGGEAVWSGGQVIGRVRSAAYGFTVSRNLAYAYLPVELDAQAQLEIEIFGERVSASITDDVLVDPGHLRARG